MHRVVPLAFAPALPQSANLRKLRFEAMKMRAKAFLHVEHKESMMRLCVMLALFVSALVQSVSAQQRATPSLTSEDLLERRSAYSAPAQSAPRINASSSRVTSVGGLYRDPAGAFSLNLPNGNWCVNTKSREKGKLESLRVFRKLDSDGFASATASVYVISSQASLPVEKAASLDASAQHALAEALAARFLSNSSSIISADALSKSAGFEVVADQLVSRRAVVRALIHAFERDGRLYVIVCRAPLESFDAEAREFQAITQSLASSVARSS